MIDIHSHIINEVDDGSQSIEMTIRMLKLSSETGTKAIIATPHFIKGRFEVGYGNIQKEVENIKRIAKENDIDIEIYCGQEVYYTKNILEYYNKKSIGTINNTRYMLIELPMLDFDINEVINILYELQIRGIVPIIAHPERYRTFIKHHSLINKLMNEGMLFQLNAGSIVGDFGNDVKKLGELYLKNNIYSFIGSDGHRDEGRDTDMTEALSVLEKSQIRRFKYNSERMLENKEVPFLGKEIKKKKLLGLW